MNSIENKLLFLKDKACRCGKTAEFVYRDQMELPLDSFKDDELIDFETEGSAVYCLECAIKQNTIHTERRLQAEKNKGRNGLIYFSVSHTNRMILLREGEYL